jgi:hypothetical protein
MTQHSSKAWVHVDYLAFDRYLREYPRPLVADPPLNKPARLREWFDVSLGAWPDNAVAKHLQVHGASYMVRNFLAEDAAAQLPRTAY